MQEQRAPLNAIRTRRRWYLWLELKHPSWWQKSIHRQVPAGLESPGTGWNYLQVVHVLEQNSVFDDLKIEKMWRETWAVRTAEGQTDASSSQFQIRSLTSEQIPLTLLQWTWAATGGELPCIIILQL